MFTLLDGKLSLSIRGNRYSANTYRSLLDEPELSASIAVIATSRAPSLLANIDILDGCYGHVRNRPLEATAKQVGVTLEGDFHPPI